VQLSGHSYNEKSFEELRSEDYAAGDKGSQPQGIPASFKNAPGSPAKVSPLSNIYQRASGTSDLFLERTRKPRQSFVYSLVVENQASHTLLDPIMHTDRNHQVILLQAMETAKADMQRRFILAIQLRIAVNILGRSMVYDMQYVENKI